MALTYRQQFLALLRRSEQDLDALFGGLADTATGALLRAATGPDGTILPAQGRAVRQEVGQAVTSLFLAQQPGERGLAAFSFAADGAPVPLSPYMRLLWGTTGETGVLDPSGVEGATLLAVQRHAAALERRLAGAPDVLAQLRTARLNPFAVARQVEAARQVREQVQWRTNPLAGYDPLHTFVHPDGYRLSDRIWRTSVETRRRIDLLLDEGIRQGRAAVDIAKDLRVFLQPGREKIVTRKPYGMKGSYDARRLTRTEITAAHMRADYISALMNPFVVGAEVRLSPAHKCCDQCDDIAAGGPYTLENVPVPPFHSHCMCSIIWTVTNQITGVVEDLRASPDFLSLVGPLLAFQFVQMLLSEPDEADVLMVA